MLTDMFVIVVRAFELACRSVTHVGRLTRCIDNVGVDDMSAVSMLFELRDDRNRTNRLSIEDKSVTGTLHLSVIRRIANVLLRRRDSLSMLECQMSEPVFDGDDALSRVEVEPIGEPVVGVHVIETQHAQG